MNQLKPFRQQFPRSIVVAFTILVSGVAVSDEQPSTGSITDSIAKNVRVQVDVLANQRYGSTPGRAGLCDVYSPKSKPPAHGFPAVLVVHGGAWISGDKWTVEGYSRKLAGNGFVAVTINYRLAPQHKFPAQVDDVRDALVWIASNAERFTIDPQRLGLFGYSAGGHLSTLVGALGDEPLSVRAAASNWPLNDPRWEQVPSIRAVCAGGPPCDFRSLPIDNTSLAYFLGGSRRQIPDVYSAASPTAHVSSADPVTQIIHGEMDLLVPIQGSQQLHRAQKAAGVDSRFETIAKQGHMVTFLSPKTASTMLAFFQEVLAEEELRVEGR